MFSIIDQLNKWLGIRISSQVIQGLMAVIALYPDRIRFSDPVYMDVRGGDYDIASALAIKPFHSA